MLGDAVINLLLKLFIKIAYHLSLGGIGLNYNAFVVTISILMLLTAGCIGGAGYTKGISSIKYINTTGLGARESRYTIREISKPVAT